MRRTANGWRQPARRALRDDPQGRPHRARRQPQGPGCRSARVPRPLIRVINPRRLSPIRAGRFRASVHFNPRPLRFASCECIRALEFKAAPQKRPGTGREEEMLTRAILDLPMLAVAGLLAVLVLGGSAKGALGIGLPLVSVPLTAQFLDLPVVIGLLTVPMIATNIGQAFEGGGTAAALRCLAPIIGALVVGTFAGAHILSQHRPPRAECRRRRSVCRSRGIDAVAPANTARPACAALGRAGGRLIVGSARRHVGDVRAAADRLPGRARSGARRVRQADLDLFLAATGTLLLALGSMGSMAPIDLLVSAAALLPIQLGLLIGRAVRRRVRPELFRVAVLCVLAYGGIDLLRRAF